MFYKERMFVLVALVLAVGQHVAAGMDKIEETCYYLKSNNAQGNVTKMFERLEKRISDFEGWAEGQAEQRKLLRAWEAVANDKKCSPATIRHLDVILHCGFKGDLQLFKKPTEDYARKCLTTDYLNKIIYSALSRYPSPKLLDRKFMDDYFALNPNKRIDLTSSECCDPSLSVFQFVRTFGGDPEKLRDPREGTNPETTEAVREYLSANLKLPCQDYSVPIDRLGTLSAIRRALRLTGDSAKRVEQLDQEVKDAIFRYNYCDMYPYMNEGRLALEVASRI